MNHTQRQKAVVIGAGIAGIASAIRLANKGYQVKVLEANNYPGGKLSQIEQNGYRFDAGPSLFTMPQYVDELFKISGKNPRDYFEYKKLDILCNYFYEDGTRLHAYADLDKFTEEITQKTNEKPENIRKYLSKSKEKYDLTAEVFLHNSLHKIGNYFTKSTAKGILGFHKLDTMTTMHQVNQKSFEDERMVQFFDRYATYNGSDPYQTPGTMNIIPHLEFGVGAFFPKNGMYSITQSLVSLAEDLGVEFQFGVRVQEILLQNKQVNGVQYQTSEGQTHTLEAQTVVSNMDIVNTYQKLLPNQKPPQKILKQTKSSSAVIFYWGVKQQFKELDLHNIFFSKEYKIEFEYLFKKQSIYSDPTVYVNISSKENPSDAPQGSENWFVMVNAPNNQGQDWDKLIAETRKNALQKLSRILKTDIESLIEAEMLLDPRSIEQKTASVQGALYGNSSNNRFAAFLRHANFSSKIKNLYFCGGSVHPGGGIPLCLLSAKIATDLVNEVK
jgi:phytoene desaturase